MNVKEYIKSWAESYKKDLTENIMPFWMKYGLDRENGGVYTCVNRDGSLMDTTKSVWFQGRFAFICSFAYNNVEKNQEWLDAAKSTLEFIEKHCFDEQGHMYFSVTAEGKPLRKRRYVFSETFAAIAMSEYALATGDQHWAKRAIQVFEDTQRFLATPGFLPAKFEADVKLQGHSIVMILINVGSCIRKVVDDPKLTQQIDESIEKLKKYFIHPEFKCLLETVGENGEFIDTNMTRTINPGHCIETSWFIMEEAKLRGCDKPMFDLALQVFDWSWDWGWDKQYGGISPSGDGRLGLIVREPAGVVACVLPWNFPLMMVGWKLGPALAEGNSVILKPASVTSLSTLKLAEFAAEAGIPEGVFNVITGPGSSVGEALGLHPGVDVVSFTGSTEVGRRFLEYAARSNLKRIVLELGGKSPFVVLDDVADYAAVAAQAAAAAFWNMGENCTANSRIIVPRKRKDAFTEALLAELENWRIGDPLDPENNLGSIVSEGQFRTIMGYIEKGKAEGGHVLTGGAPLAIGSGLFIPPTIFDGVTPDMTIVREEIFGPVTAILPADSDEEAVGLANATAYGLQATLFTEDVTKAHKYARALKAGTVSVNCFSEGDNTTPFGGYKLSGFGGKDKGRESHDQYTETKTIFLNLDR